MKKTITVSGIESDTKKTTLLEDTGKTRKDGSPKPDKYKIWNQKKDGTPTKAYTQFQKIRPSIGDSFEIEVAEEEKEYNGFPYTDRTVMFFYTQDEHGTPSQASNLPPRRPETPKDIPTQPQTSFEALEAKIKEAFAKRDKEIFDLSERVSKLELGDEYFPQTGQEINVEDLNL